MCGMVRKENSLFFISVQHIIGSSTFCLVSSVLLASANSRWRDVFGNNKEVTPGALGDESVDAR